MNRTWCTQSYVTRGAQVLSHQNLHTYITLHYSTVQYSTVQYITLHYSALHYSTLHYIHEQDLVHTIVCHQRGTSPVIRSYILTLHHITLHYSTLHYSTLHYIHEQDLVHTIVCHQRGTSPKSSEPTYLHYITLHYSTVHHITLHYSALHYSTLHYIHEQDLVHTIVCHQRGTSPKSSEATYLHYITLHYSTVQYSTLHYSTFSVLFPRCASPLWSLLHYPVVVSRSSSQPLKKLMT